MPVNTYSIYTTNSGKPKEYIEGGAIVPDQTQIWLPNNPSQYYEIHLYNMSSCKKNSDHYIYGTYLGGISSLFLTSNKFNESNHEKAPLPHWKKMLSD